MSESEGGSVRKRESVWVTGKVMGVDDGWEGFWISGR